MEKSRTETDRQKNHTIDHETNDRKDPIFPFRFRLKTFPKSVLKAIGPGKIAMLHGASSPLCKSLQNQQNGSFTWFLVQCSLTPGSLDY